MKVTPDPVYNSVLVAKFINSMICDGKKALAQKIFYETLKILKEKTGKDGLEVFEETIEKIKPNVQVKSRRVGGSTYQVPVEVYPARKQSLAIRWILQAARKLEMGKPCRLNWRLKFWTPEKNRAMLSERKTKSGKWPRQTEHSLITHGSSV